MFDRIQKIFIDNHRLVGVPPHLRSYRYLRYTKYGGQNPKDFYKSHIGQNPKDFYRQPQVGGGTPTLTELSLPTIYKICLTESKRCWTESKRFFKTQWWTESKRFLSTTTGWWGYPHTYGVIVTYDI